MSCTITYESWKQVVEEMIPYAQKTGIKLDALSPYQCALSLPFDATNTNPMGMLHAGPPFVLAELAGATILSASLDVTKYSIINKEVKVKFKRPCTGDIFVKLQMSEADAKKIEDEVAANGKTDAEVKVPVTDANGNILVEAEAVYRVRPL